MFIEKFSFTKFHEKIFLNESLSTRIL